MSNCTCAVTHPCPMHDGGISGGGSPKPKPYRVIPDTNYDLTSKETEIRDLLIKGISNTDIAVRMGLKPKRVRNLMLGIYRKYKCTTRTEVIATHFGLR